MMSKSGQIVYATRAPMTREWNSLAIQSQEFEVKPNVENIFFALFDLLKQRLPFGIYGAPFLNSELIVSKLILEAFSQTRSFVSHFPLSPFFNSRRKCFESIC